VRLTATTTAERPLPGAILGFCYFYFLLHWGTGLALFASKLGFSTASIATYYRGDPEQFINPRSFSGLLEVTHFHLFAMGVFFVVFSHLLCFTDLQRSCQRLMTLLLAVSLLGDLAAGWLVRYAAAGFAWFKLGDFILLQTVSLVLLAALARAHFYRRRQASGQPAG